MDDGDSREKISDKPEHKNSKLTADTRAEYSQDLRREIPPFHGGHSFRSWLIFNHHLGRIRFQPQRDGALQPKVVLFLRGCLGCAFGNGNNANGVVVEVRSAGGNGGAATMLRLAGWEGLEARKRIAQGKRTP